MNVTESANCLYDKYEYETDSSYAKSSVDSSDVSSKIYNIKDVSDALDTLDTLSSTSAFSTITNLDTYVRNQYLLSQSSSSDILGTLTDSSGSSIYRAGTLDSAVSAIYSEASLGLSDDNADFDIYGVLTSDKTASSQISENSIKSDTASGSTGSYDTYLSKSISTYDSNA